MRSRGAIMADINAVKGQITEYNANITELEEAKKYLESENKNVEGIAGKLKSYDVTRGDKWLGDLNNTMSENRDVIVGDTTNYKTDVSTFIGEIDVAIGKLKDLIDDCHVRLADLEAELASCDDRLEMTV